MAETILDLKGNVIVADEFRGTITSEALAGVAALTGTVGTANDAMTAVVAAVAATTDTSAASLASVNTAITAINNNLADLQAKVNVILNALK